MWGQQVRASYSKRNVSMRVYKNRMVTYESNTPKVIAYGVHLNDSGTNFFEQIVLPASSSNLAVGNRAAHVQVRNHIQAGSSVRTILERSHHCKEGGIECIPVVVYAYCIDVKTPHCFTGVDA